MAYLPNFEFDVFISYAHVDDLTALGSGSPGWVHQFHEQLKIYLWKRAGRADSVKIWRDPVLDGNQLFDRTIQERVERSALFVALTSQGYVESEYCLKELHCFHRRATADDLDWGAAARLWHKAGARLIGGCCRTTPATIRRLRQAFPL